MNKITSASMTAVIILSLAGCGCSGKTAEEPTRAPAATAEAAEEGAVSLGWENIQDTFNELYEFSETIVRGTPVSKEYYDYNGLPFTAVTVKVDKIIKGEVGEDEIVLSYSGGVIDGVEYNSRDQLIPSEGEEYLFLLDPSMPGDKYYYPAGGFQGTFRISGTDDTSVIEEFNPSNYIETEVVGMTLSEITGE